MNAIDPNDQLLGTVGAGINAAAAHFARRMEGIAERRPEPKTSKTWEEMAFSFARQVDELTTLLREREALALEQAARLESAMKDRDRAHAQSRETARHLVVVSKRLFEVEDGLPRPSAHGFATDPFLKVALHEEFMESPTVKKGPPPLPSTLRRLFRP